MSSCARSDCDQPPRSRGYCEKHYRYLVHTGRFGYVDAAPARRHVKALRSAGWTFQQISDAAGVSIWTPNQLARGRVRRTLRETSAAILAIEVTPADSHRGVFALGTFRRIEALQWMGWPMPEIARRVGIKPYTLTTLRCRGENVSYRTARAVAEVYEQLSHLPGPSQQTATKARKRGYAPPLAWDNPDDLRERPKGVAA